MKRLPGVDLMRGIAAFGVILIHTGLVVGGQTAPAVQAIQGAFGGFAVPFFIAAAFYFALCESGRNPEAPWLTKRISRLLGPYVAWTAIYVGLLFIDKRFLRHQAEATLLADPVGAILFGASGVALYFVPLIIVGFAVLRMCSSTLLHLRVKLSSEMWAVAVVAHEVLVRTGNGFDLSTTSAFQPLLRHAFETHDGSPSIAFTAMRIAAVVLAHALRCLPYFFLVAPMAARHHSPIGHKDWVWLGFGSAVACASVTGTLQIPESLVGSSFLLLAIAGGGLLPRSLSLIAPLLGAASFGVYLSHQLLLEALKMILRGMIPIPAGVLQIMALALFTFLVTSAATLVAKGRFLLPGTEGKTPAPSDCDPCDK